MRRAFSDFSPAVPAAFAAGLGVSLWIFLLPAGVVQKRPTPVLPALGGAAGRVVADLPVPAERPEVQKAVSAHSTFVIALRPPAPKPRRVRHQTRTRVVRRGSSAPVREAPVTTVTKSQLFSLPTKAKGKARGHEHGDEAESEAETPTPRPPGHRRALGRSNEREDRLPPGLAKKASRAWAPGRPRPPKGNGYGNGRKGNDDGKRDKGNGHGDGRGGEEK